MAAAPQHSDLPGYRVGAVEAWIAENIDSLTPPFTWTRLQGGHSNLTYLIEDASGARAVIRRPPEGELLPKAHDMSREWSLISSLAPTGVPVPAPLGFCESPDVTGAWFYVMGWVEGHALMSADDTRAYVPESERPKTAFSVIDAMAALHTPDPDEIGLGELGKKDSYIARQLKTWYRSWTSSAERSNMDDPRAHALYEFFLEHLPEQGPAKVVHGDLGLHNVLIGPDHTVAAIVDWEISTLGDPKADLAYYLLQFPDENDAEPLPDKSAGAVPGFPGRAELAARYGEKRNVDLSNLDYYYGFNNWKSAAIIQGVLTRYVGGNKSAEGVDLDFLNYRLERALKMGTQAVERLK